MMDYFSDMLQEKDIQNEALYFVTLFRDGSTELRSTV